MFERYTQAARATIFWGRYMAGQAGSVEIETEQLLLGLLRADKTLGMRFLGSPWAAEIVWKKLDQVNPRRKQATPTEIPLSKEIPLSSESKRVLALAAEEADLFSDRRICTHHLLLGLLRYEKCLAATILSELGVQFASARDQLSKRRHDDSKTEDFVRERSPLPEDVVELQSRVESIRSSLENAISSHDFEKAQACSDEERVEREKLLRLYRRYGLLDWIYD